MYVSINAICSAPREILCHNVCITSLMLSLAVVSIVFYYDHSIPKTDIAQSVKMYQINL